MRKSQPRRTLAGGALQQRTDFRRSKSYAPEAMATKYEPKTIGELIDQLEQIREDLLTLQRSFEKIEFAATAVAKPGRRRARVRLLLK